MITIPVKLPKLGFYYNWRRLEPQTSPMKVWDHAFEVFSVGCDSDGSYDDPNSWIVNYRSLDPKAPACVVERQLWNSDLLGQYRFPCHDSQRVTSWNSIRRTSTGLTCLRYIPIKDERLIRKLKEQADRIHGWSIKYN